MTRLFTAFTADDGKALIGSLSAVLGKSAQMHTVLPDWLEKGVESSLRESEDDKPVTPVPTAISSSSVGQRAKAVASPVVLTPTAGSRPDSRQDSSRGTFAQDLESFYADALSSSSEEGDEDSEESGEEDEEEAEEAEADEPLGSESDNGSENDDEDEDEGRDENPVNVG